MTMTGGTGRGQSEAPRPVEVDDPTAPRRRIDSATGRRACDPYPTLSGRRGSLQRAPRDRPAWTPGAGAACADTRRAGPRALPVGGRDDEELVALFPREGLDPSRLDRDVEHERLAGDHGVDARAKRRRPERRAERHVGLELVPAVRGWPPVRRGEPCVLRHAKLAFAGHEAARRERARGPGRAAAFGGVEALERDALELEAGARGGWRPTPRPSPRGRARVARVRARRSEGRPRSRSPQDSSARRRSPRSRAHPRPSTPG